MMEVKTKKLIGLGTAIVLLVGVLLSGEDVDKIVEQERAKAAASNTPKHSALVNSGQCEDIIRMVAPDANELLYATRLLEGAADKSYAAANIKLQKQRDLAITQSEIWKFKAEEAKSREEHAKAIRNLRLLESNSGALQIESATTVNNDATATSDESMTEDGLVNGGDYSLKLRLRGVNEDRSMLFSKGDQWFRNVRVGQFIDNVEITAYDPKLECVSLAVDGKELLQKLCTN
ncbi:hypothetical protein DBT82_RS18230 [Vibrio parahaemolyticus]|nr:MULTISPECIES: hypothetical protein [Vibrio harveyi group]EGQ8101321.1 hypothetical protein [Vibrio parahaemolyticus]EGQ8229584.1 hypothetical protein [Vibrio parahaemolyticus]EGQ8329868.1 hypothetical protein [Vibrio parahaemolyticus]EGQ8551095.1 hypothetical protein [Vibrio parahaemolyticus]EGQ8789063.1 hypothetical protein [Vibrio parahaemolyticus]